jgi:hypothetical protein
MERLNGNLSGYLASFISRHISVLPYSFPARLSFCRAPLFAGGRLASREPWEAGRPSRSLRRLGLLLAAVVAGGPLGFLPEAAGEGVRVGRHGARQGAVAGIDAEVAGEVVLGVPGGRADRRAARPRRGRPGRRPRCRAAPAGTPRRGCCRRTPSRRLPCRRPGRVPPPWRRPAAGPRSAACRPAGSAGPGLMAQSGIRTVRMPAADTRESDDRDVSCVA